MLTHKPFLNHKPVRKKKKLPQSDSFLVKNDLTKEI